MGTQKKRVLISQYDSTDITDSEIEYRKDNLKEFGNIVEKIMEKLDDDTPGHERFKALFDGNKFEELARELKKETPTSTIVEEVIREDVYEDFGIYQLYWNDEKEAIKSEWNEASYAGHYREQDYAGYEYYRDGTDLLSHAIKGHQSDDYEMWREPDGSITIIAGCRSYTFVPVEADYRDWIGKYVIDLSSGVNIAKITDFSAYDGSYAEFGATIYSGNSNALLKKDGYVSEHELVVRNNSIALLSSVKDALHVKKVKERMEDLADAGIKLDDNAIKKVFPSMNSEFDLVLTQPFRVPQRLPGDELSYILAVLSLVKSGKQYIYGFPSKDELSVSMIDLLLKGDKTSSLMVDKTYEIRDELARGIGAARRTRDRLFHETELMAA